MIITHKLSDDLGNQLEVKPNAVVTDDALMQQFATAHCACQVAAMLTCKTSELTGLDLWPPNRTTL